MAATAADSMQYTDAAPPLKPSPSALLEQAADTKLTDHAQFLRTLDMLEHERTYLTDAQRWQLKYLQAWQTAYEGSFPKANDMLHEIIANSGIISVSAKASAMLIYSLNAGGHYEASYKVANDLINELPMIKDRRARYAVLEQVSQMMELAGQYDLAIKYARQLQTLVSPEAAQCRPRALLLSAQFHAHTLHSDNPELKQVVDACLSQSQLVYANVLRIDRSEMLIDEGHPRQAIDLLHRIKPGIVASGYQRQLAQMHSLLARAYLKQGNVDQARREALDTLSLRNATNFEDVAKVVYKVLWQVEKARGNDASALAYYEKYALQNQSLTNDAKARALAYQMSKQEMLARKLNLEALRKQNRILQLRQSLDLKSSENSRLYITLLLFILTLILFWTYRIKHSQMHFRRMARHDDLTDALNRQYFLDQAERILKRLEKDREPACLMILDMDYFKRINDRHGHIFGDRVLRHATAHCHDALRDSDLLGRLGGEEFGILMPSCSLEKGREIAHRIRAAMVGSPLKSDNNETVIATASIGMTGTQRSGYDIKQLMSHADTALYDAKQAGRNQLVISTRQPPSPPQAISNAS